MPESCVDLRAEIFLLLESDWAEADRLRGELAVCKSAALVLLLLPPQPAPKASSSPLSSSFLSL